MALLQPSPLHPSADEAAASPSTAQQRARLMRPTHALCVLWATTALAACATATDTHHHDASPTSGDQLIAVTTQTTRAPSPAASTNPANDRRRQAPSPGAQGITAITQPWSTTATITGSGFNPGEITVRAGWQVTVKNTDRQPHTWTSDQGFWDSGILQPGQSFSISFQTPGTFRFHDRLDASTQGTVTVSEASP